ncbi:MAG TPA: type II toxin-antitoxin system prevent-host-death family antitoxin [Fibrobacteres bacterium]|jgi:antitoxin Phd|nr:type II toxin-antitoxin system prevent-host-death family antitoxin [Fibrobacterota bacterium]
MSAVWKLQDAKNKFSEVINNAETDGPQEITRHGKKTAVVLSFGEYQKLKKKQGGLLEFFNKSPLKGLNIERVKDYPREVSL